MKQFLSLWLISVSLFACSTSSTKPIKRPSEFDVPPRSFLYKDVMSELAEDLSKIFPPNTRIAVLKIPSHTGENTNFSSNVATKLEIGFINAGRDVVDRVKIDHVLKEQQFQQNSTALFDVNKTAMLGKFVGANIVISGEYLVILPEKVIVTARAVSVETTKIIGIREKEILLSNEGSINWDSVTELLRPTGNY